MPQHPPRVRRASPVNAPPANALPAPARPGVLPGPADRSPRALHSFGQIALTPPAVQRCACRDKQEQETPAHSVQFKLTVNTPGDRYEQEADATADQVLRMSAPTEGAQLQRCAACEEEAQRQETSEGAGGEDLATADVSGIVSAGLASGGRPLDPDTRAFMEPRFGHDFSQVRIHDSPAASSSAQSVSARAYTVGSSIAFRSGEFSPGSGDGRRLLAHELTHVVQQGAATPLAPGVQRSLWVSQMTGPNVQRFAGSIAGALTAFGEETLAVEAVAAPEEAVAGPPGWALGLGALAVGGLAMGAGYLLSDHDSPTAPSAPPTAAAPTSADTDPLDGGGSLPGGIAPPATDTTTDSTMDTSTDTNTGTDAKTSGCTDEVYQKLNEAVDQTCKAKENARSCGGPPGWPNKNLSPEDKQTLYQQYCSQYKTSIQLFKDCIAAREKRDEICPEHAGKHGPELDQQRRGLKNCEKWLNKLNCS